MTLEGRIALVTGASRGIGRAIAQTLANAGATVGAVATKGDLLESLAREQTGRPGAIIPYVGDVTDAAFVERTVEALTKRAGRWDILVNNAGITRDGLLMRMSEDDWDRVIAVNLKAAFLWSRPAVKSMIRQRAGRIINVASVTGIMGNPGQANYAASKGGLIAFSKALAKEVAARGVTVNAVAPGFVDTEMTSTLGTDVKEKALGVIPMGRFGRVEDIAAGVLYLAGDGASYVTGQVLVIDGGLCM